MRAAAFHLLLGHFEPIGVEALAAETGITPERLNQLLQELGSYRRHTVLLAERQGSLSRS